MPAVERVLSEVRVLQRNSNADEDPSLTYSKREGTNKTFRRDHLKMDSRHQLSLKENVCIS